MGLTASLVGAAFFGGSLLGKSGGKQQAPPPIPTNNIKPGPKPAPKAPVAPKPFGGTLLTGPMGLGELPSGNAGVKTLLGF